MHEFSLASEVLELARYEAEKNNAVSVTEITIEVGNLCGVEADVFESALTIISEGTILGKAVLNILKIKGTGKCSACNTEFEMDNRMDYCPVCHSLPAEIIGGKEFRVVSLVIENE